MLTTSLRRLRRRRGQFFLGGLCSCCGCPVTFHVTCGISNVHNATVTVSSGGTPVASGTTNTSGLVTLTIPSGGTYMVTATGSTCTSGYLNDLTLVCGNTYTLPCCQDVCSACHFDVVYPTLYVTDSHTTTACPFSGGGGVWFGCYQLPVSSPATTPCGCAAGTHTATGNSSITYQISCNKPGSSMAISRSWGSCDPGGGATCYYCSNIFDSSCNLIPATCSGSTQYTCGGLYPSSPGDGQITETAYLTLSNCSPFPLYASFSSGSCGSGAGEIFDPLGPNVTIST